MTGIASNERSASKAADALSERRKLALQRHRRRLLIAAGATFAEHGYADATVNLILETAGMSRRSFYEHFTSKEDILVWLLSQARGEIAGESSELESSAGNEPSPLLRAWCLAQAYLTVVRTFRFVRDPAAASQSRQVHEAYAELNNFLHDQLIKAVRRAQPEGVRDDEQIRASAMFFLSGLESLAHGDIDDDQDFQTALATAQKQLKLLFA